MCLSMGSLCVPSLGIVCAWLWRCPVSVCKESVSVCVADALRLSVGARCVCFVGLPCADCGHTLCLSAGILCVPSVDLWGLYVSLSLY